MKLLENAILEKGKILPGNILKIDSFLNHNIDVSLVSKLGEEFYRLYKDCSITKILTIEASGIAVACFTAQYFNVPVLFAKKEKTGNIGDELYSAPVHSYTHNKDYTAVISKEFISSADRVLIVDDFLAEGSALLAMISLVQQSGATVAGAGIVVEKAFQDGGKIVRNQGYRVESLAKIASFSEEGLEFVKE